jgi:glycosyltransferase involved in cell wall biosynthesis
MHVLFVNARYSPEGIAGPAFTTQHLAEQLVREGSRASVVCRTEQRGIHEDSIAGVKVVRIGLDIRGSAVLALMPALFERLRPDIIHTLFPREFLLDSFSALAHERDIPIVHTLLAFFLLCPQGSIMRNGRRCKVQCTDCHTTTAAQRRFAARVDAVVGISRYMLDLHQRWGLFGDTAIQRVIHDAYQPPHPAAVPSATGTPLRLGYLGRIDPLKGVDLLLRTLNGELAHRNWTLTLGGRGEPGYEKNLRTFYTDGRIRFLGFVRPADLLGDIDILVVPSLWEEPFPRVLIEAHAHGVAVLGSNRGGLPEGIEPGQTGLVFDPDEQGALAHAITMLLDDPQLVADMKAKAMAKAATAYTPANILSQYRSVYAAVLSGASRS